MLRRIFSHIAAFLLAGACLYAAEGSAVWLDVPFVKQEKNACGAASIAMVMQFWQHQQRLLPNADADEARIQLDESRDEARVDRPHQLQPAMPATNSSKRHRSRRRPGIAALDHHEIPVHAGKEKCGLPPIFNGQS